jgi:peptidyl-prolyl cis-trans isomerase D
MLRSLNDKKTQKRIWFILIPVIIVSFVFWGIGQSSKESRNEVSPGIIFGRKVTPQEYSRAIRETKAQFKLQFGDNLPAIEKFLNTRDIAWERLILLAEAKKRRIKVSDNDVRKAIANNPIFARKGVFDAGYYESVIRYGLRIQPRDFEEQMRHNLMLSKLNEQVTSSASVSDQELAEAYKKENEQISVSYIAAKPADFKTQITVSDEELKLYFDSHSADFKKQASYKLEYVAFTGEHQVVGFNALREQKGSFDKAVADTNSQLKETEWFFLDDPIPGIGWVKEISEILPRMKKGEILPPAVVDKNYYVMRVKDTKEPFVPAFEDVKDKVNETVISQKAQEMAKEKISLALAKLKGSQASSGQAASFDAIAEEFGLTSNSTDPFKSGSYIQDIGSSDKFFSEAQKLEEGQFSEIIGLPVGFYIIKVKQVIPIDETKFAQEKDKFKEKILNQKKQKLFEAFIIDLKTRTKRFREPQISPAIPQSEPAVIPEIPE